jgi:hypothetical protein
MDCKVVFSVAISASLPTLRLYWIYPNSASFLIQSVRGMIFKKMSDLREDEMILKRRAPRLDFDDADHYLLWSNEVKGYSVIS